MPQTPTDALKQATFYTDNQPYRLVRLPANAITAAAGVIAEIAEPFCALLIDKDEITLMIPQDALNDFRERLPGHQPGGTYRLITIDAILAPDLIGFMATLSTALAHAGVGVFPYAAYTRDHIFVPEHQHQTALTTLQALKTDHAG
jgi:hypothetical protein